MTLLRLVQRASILAGMTFASLSIHSNPAHAEPEFCIVASNGKTLCGKTKGIERMCITTNGSNTICGKFKSAKEGQEQGQEETRNPAPSSGARKELDGITFLLRSCRRSNSDIKCNFVMKAKKAKDLVVRSGKGTSSIVDSVGRTYVSSNVEYNGRIESNINITLSPEVDYVVDVNFENIPGQMTQASLLNISTGKPYQTREVVQFRNVPFSN